MTMVGGFDVHRNQITFAYVDDDGLVRWGQIRPATRKTLRHWLVKHCPDGNAEFALEGCTGWRHVVEELRAAGVRAHLGDPAEIAALRGPKKRAKTDRGAARLLRTLLLEWRFPESWIPPAHVVEIRTLGRLYYTLMDEQRAWQQRIHAQLSDAKRSPGHLSRQGSPELRWAAFEAAKCAARRGSPDHAYYEHLAARPHNGKNPTLSVERKLLRRCYHTLRELGDTALAMPATEPHQAAA